MRRPQLHAGLCMVRRAAAGCACSALQRRAQGAQVTYTVARSVCRDSAGIGYRASLLGLQLHPCAHCRIRSMSDNAMCVYCEPES